ncbi:hypothetical protein [Microbacterium aurantiacum]|mgnify:CR=1 FL=1|uniref:Uncharacterized protein n=1 Tax=Microbacterium aurantiacum TaxID=162393 RepID=A0ABT8FUY3_9MICO|nr:hypothetical protein [Microbacterium aurantiacum]MBN9201726.1 hypothetical protein [Microbacterium chocolatum]MDN4464995.1 hypothetical protein [Microbacterium aurantiacum]ODT11240.1 MAG: hypothetical protein ABS61_04975 [Microbacterium sp. SCN 70-18]
MASFEKLLWGDSADPRRELAEIFPDDTGSAVVRAREWARDVIADAGVEASDELRAIHALRAAEPRLSLKPARFLAAQLRG